MEKNDKKESGTDFNSKIKFCLLLKSENAIVKISGSHDVVLASLRTHYIDQDSFKLTETLVPLPLM